MASNYADLKSIPVAERKAFIDSFDAILADCDGVLWLGNKLLPGSPDVINQFAKMGKRVYFVTNNSTKTREEFLQKCNKLGFEIGVDSVVSTAWLTANYLKSRNFNKKAYIVGPEAVRVELETAGITGFGIGPDLIKTPSSSYVVMPELAKTEENVGAVIVGYDHYFSLPKIVKAANYLNDPEVIFIGTNTDERFPRDNNVVWPGTGVFVRAIETVAQRSATIMGKPSGYIIDEFLKQVNIEPSRALMIGDRCNTDIMFGKKSGMTTILVLTGVHQLKDLEEFKKNEQNDLLPTYYAQSMADLQEFFDAK